jgi:hypothetical protein
MEFTDFMLWKFGALLVLAFIYNFIIGFTRGSRPTEEQREPQAAEPSASAADVPGLTDQR